MVFKNELADLLESRLRSTFKDIGLRALHIHLDEVERSLAGAALYDLV